MDTHAYDIHGIFCKYIVYTHRTWSLSIYPLKNSLIVY